MIAASRRVESYLMGMKSAGKMTGDFEAPQPAGFPNFLGLTAVSSVDGCRIFFVIFSPESWIFRGQDIPVCSSVGLVQIVWLSACIYTRMAVRPILEGSDLVRSVLGNGIVEEIEALKPLQKD